MYSTWQNSRTHEALLGEHSRTYSLGEKRGEHCGDTQDVFYRRPVLQDIEKHNNFHIHKIKKKKKKTGKYNK